MFRSEGQEAFKGLYDIPALSTTSVVLPYDQWNTAANSFCTSGGSEPGRSVGQPTVVASQWIQTWDMYTEFQKQPSAENSVVIAEIYSRAAIGRSVPDSATAFAHRGVNVQATVIPWYTDPSLDAAANAYANKVRDIWRANVEEPSSCINFAHGDEDLKAVYGENLAALQDLKKTWDPRGRSNQWFSLG